jgi:hypothetical protein
MRGKRQTMEKTNVIKLRFLKNGIPSGGEYSYLTGSPVSVGDYVEAPVRLGTAQAIVTAVNVPEAEIAPFRGRVKSIVGVSPSKPANETKIHIKQEEKA